MSVAASIGQITGTLIKPGRMIWGALANIQLEVISQQCGPAVLSRKLPSSCLSISSFRRKNARMARQWIGGSTSSREPPGEEADSHGSLFCLPKRISYFNVKTLAVAGTGRASAHVMCIRHDDAIRINQSELVFNLRDGLRALQFPVGINPECLI